MRNTERRTKMSKGLKALKKIKETNSYMIQIQDKCICVPYYDDIEKELTALEIIKEKPLTLYLIENNDNYDVYFELALHIASTKKEIYSREEFELLKEVLL